MDDSGPTASFFFVLLILISMLFNGFKTAMYMLNMKEIEKNIEESNKKYIKLTKLLSMQSKYTYILQTVSTLCTMLYGSFFLATWTSKINHMLQNFMQQYFTLESKLITEMLGGFSFVVALFLLMYIFLTFGIYFPRKLASRNPERYVFSSIHIIYFVSIIFLPFTKLSAITVHYIMFLFGSKSGQSENDVTEEEIINMVNEGHEQGIILASEAEMISNIFEFGEKEAQDIMTNRKNIIAIDEEMLLSDAINFMLSEKNSRFPVFRDTIDNIVGILHLKDVMRFCADATKSDATIKNVMELVREAIVIPQTKNINELFKSMQSQKLQMVIVIDEYGQTVGLVAMEDILEEIVGNIMDEYDEDNYYIEKYENDEYIIDGRTALEELEEEFDITFEENEYDTLNGFLISKMEKIPEENEQFEIEVDGYIFKILSVENKMIHEVFVKRIGEKQKQV